MSTMADEDLMRTHTQALLDLTEARLRAIIDAATDSIISADTQGYVIQVNRATEHMFGYTASELLGSPLSILLPERFRAAHHAGLERYLTTGETRVIGRTVELAALRKSGEEFPVELSLAVCRTANGPIFTGILRDITWRRQIEHELAAKRTQLETINKELEAFSYSVSHDLRMPLRSIQGFSRVLLEECDHQLNEVGRDALRRVRAAVERMEWLIDAMLALSQVTRSELHDEPVDLSPLAHAITADLRKQDPQRDVDVVIQPDLTTNGDSRLLRVLLENLLGNAWKATASRNPGRIELGVGDDDGRRAFFVRDNGIGFDPAHAHKLFRPLQALHRRTEFPGTGIGLATVQRIVAKHGGSVWAEGQPNEGAVFFFALGSPKWTGR